MSARKNTAPNPVTTPMPIARPQSRHRPSGRGSRSVAMPSVPVGTSSSTSAQPVAGSFAPIKFATAISMGDTNPTGAYRYLDDMSFLFFSSISRSSS